MACALLLLAAIAASQPPPTFHSGTQLVQVSVIAQDNQRKPVAGLRREDFQILDNGLPREIQLFLAESSNPSQRPESPGFFTNQIAASTGSHSGYSVILIDTSFTDFGSPADGEGSSLSRVKTLQMLRSRPAGEKIALYATGRRLQIICEFTSDLDLLERQLARWKPSVDTPGNVNAILLASLGETSDDHRGDAPEKAAEAKNANVAIYPVDANGVNSVLPASESARLIAEQTGGIFYHGRNDIDAAISEAMDDGRFSYTPGFYRSDDDRTPQVHQIAVRVDKPGLTLRYRTTYDAETPRIARTPAAGLVQALDRPIDPTGVPVNASVKRVLDRLDVRAVVDAGALELMRNRDRWVGKVEIMGRFMEADARPAGDAVSQTLTLNLSQSTYDTALRQGIAYHNTLKIPPKAVELRLLFANPASGKIGTLIVPLSEVSASGTK